MDRIKTYDATGIAPNGRLYAGDLNQLQDVVAALYALTQNLGANSLAVGEAGLVLSRYGAGEGRISGAFRTDGILRGLGGLYAGAFTTAQRNAIGAGLAPYGLIILNTDTNQYEWNSGTDGARAWQSLSGSIAKNVTNVGDGVATTFNIVHNMGTRDMLVMVRENASPYRQVIPEVRFLDANTVQIIFDVAPIAGQYTVTLLASAVVNNAALHSGTHLPGGSDAINFAAVHNQGTLAARPAAGPTNAGLLYFATDEGVIYRSNGTTWESWSGASYGTALPTTNLYNGRRFTLFGTSPVSGHFAWELVYRADLDADDPWYFYGGSPLAGTTTITIPRRGDYKVEIGSRGGSFGATDQVILSLTAGGITLDARGGGAGGGTQGNHFSIHDSDIMVGLTTGQVLTPTSSGSSGAARPYIRATPVKIG